MRATVRPFWDVHRFRVSPQVEAVLDREVAAGKLAYIAARLVRVTEAADGIRVEYRPRGRGDVVVDRFDTVVVTTGPAHRDALRTNPVLMTMAQQGLVRPDPLGMGLLVEDRCRAVDGAGAASRSLFVTGPLARGHIGELMGVPEVTAHAEATAAEIASELSTIAVSTRRTLEGWARPNVVRQH